MPHLVVEYTNNLLPGFDPAGTLAGLNQALIASGQFQEADIKSRAGVLEALLVGSATGGEPSCTPSLRC